MIGQLIKKFHQDRRGVTALMMALMAVPLILSAGVAVDFSRISSVRAQMQASVDAAALAGSGAYQLAEQPTNANQVGQAALTGTSKFLTNFVAINSTTVNAYCSAAGSATQCGTGSVTAPASAKCPTSYEYCVKATMTATLKNSLIAYWIPSEVLSVSSVATTAFPPNIISNANFPHHSVGSAYDSSGIYAYAVPMTGNTPNYANVPAPNSNCAGITGPLQYATLSPANGSSQCNYLYIGDSTGDIGDTTQTLSVPQNNPIAFTFVNYTGKTTQYGINTSYNYTTQITVNGVYKANGQTITYGTGRNATSTQLYGECPANNLYGSITAYPTFTNNVVPSQDSLNIFSSAYEMQGYPPTHNVNHNFVSFTNTITEKVNNTSYTVAVQCPRWPTTGTNINAYGSYYPDVTVTDDNSLDIYPPQFSGCTPVTTATSTNATPNASSSNPWWGWSNSNSGNCISRNAVTNSTTNNALQTSNYNNCALIVQDLGTNIPNDATGTPRLPDYYTMTESSNGAILDLNPVYNGVGNSNAATYYPTNKPGYLYYTKVLNADGKTYTVTEQPAETSPGNTYLNDLPLDTSGQCYNPQANGIAASAGTNNNGTAIDPVANPQLSTVICNQATPENYALYWNDMGGFGDDMGYWNAIVEFTCSVPPTTNAGGGPPSLSG